MTLTAKCLETGEKVSSLDPLYTSGYWTGRDRFQCIGCGGKMVFVNATKRVKHFRHKATPCNFFAGETEEHLRMKKYFFDLFKDQGAVLETRVGKYIADVLIPQYHVAIECQRGMDYDYVLDKLKYYTDNGFYCLWVLPASRLSEKRRRSETEKFLHNIYKGKVFYCDGKTLFASHFEWIRGKTIFSDNVVRVDSTALRKETTGFWDYITKQETDPQYNVASFWVQCWWK